eukprot:TRINITY_DN3_c0_g1_i1.p1 TRINITY_DN3_c0_g1~~TRINITY_DN3_c0_g1_i1.p1  ORF type:complete len:303 (-),score=83.98 TRINITY_DN3_c0_g1_i1:46-954(-)
MTEKIEDHYDLKQVIGKGAFSVVHEATNKKTGERVAVKIIDHKTAEEGDQKRLQTEIAILKKVNHPNVVGLRDLFETSEKLYLVMELITGGELFDKIVERGQYSEKDASVIVKKMISAVEYLHANGIAHRDLKPENLLLRGADETDVMLSDFGLSKIMTGNTMMETACGTPYYVAPEVLSGEGYDKEVDMWSVGVITYLLLCGFPPFYGESLPEVFEQIMKAEFDFPAPYWTDITPHAKDFISKLLVTDTVKRLTASQASQHPWVNAGNVPTTPLHLDQSQKAQQFQSMRKLQSAAKLKNTD